MSEGPEINEDLPIGKSLSPPYVGRPVYDCAEAVHLSAFVPHAVVHVYVNGVDLVAEEQPPFGFADVKLSRRLKAGDTVTATQIVDGVESVQSAPPVTVDALPGWAVSTTRPGVDDVLYECGKVVPVRDLVPSTRVHVYEDGGEIGVAPTATSWLPVVTAPLHKDGQVTARQFGCEGTDHQIDGLLSEPPVRVRAAPAPVPPPGIDEPSLIVGNDVVTLTGLLVGAEVQITRGGVVLGGGLATAAANSVPLNAKLTGETISATQKLCANSSVPAEATPAGTLDAPLLVEPVCDHARHVVVRKTVVNAIVVVLRGGTPIGYAGAGPGDIVVQLGSGLTLHSGDQLTAVQYLGSPGAWTISPPSNTVTVARRVEAPAVEILGGHPSFVRRPGEQPIPGPVFPRGAGPGPEIRVQACCQGDVQIQILDAEDRAIAEPTATEIYPGYYSAAWPWTSWTGWTIPDGIPVGEYTVAASASCIPQQETREPFFVIFDPAAVNGPPRFSFDATAIWFGAYLNAVAALPYYLHLSDGRVFMPAIEAVQGKTDPYAAAHALFKAEDALFLEDLNQHAYDVVYLITTQTHAQCADDACCLTAFLRAMGIPAHPVTADAAEEYPPPDIVNRWNFDTWVEFLSDHGGTLEWRVLHPHQFHTMTAESRRTFGTTRDVAMKRYNDLIVMADENWVPAEVGDASADVWYSRNECLEPIQALMKSAWVKELCEDGYWDQTHWDCAGARFRALVPDRLTLDDEELRFGGVLTGTLHLENQGEEDLRGQALVELFGSRPEVKRLAETTYAELDMDVALTPGESVELPIRLDLPATLPPGQSLLVSARVVTADASLQVGLRQVPIPAGVEAELEWAADGLAVDERSTARVVIRNVSDEPVRDVIASVTVPFALRADDAERPLGDLEPGAEREIEWTLSTVAPIDAGVLRAAVATGNGGSALIQRPFQVAEPVDLVGVQVAAPLPDQ